MIFCNIIQSVTGDGARHFKISSIKLSIFLILLIINSVNSFVNSKHLIRHHDVVNRALCAMEVKVLNMDNNEQITIASGSPLSLAAVRSGMRLSFQCKAGHCASCEMLLNGEKVRTCMTKVPEKAKISIKKVMRK